MSELGIIHFIDYLQRVENGDKVIWDAGMRWLTCFSDKYSRDHSRTIGARWNPMFELIYEFDTSGNWDHKNPIGIRFQCADEQLFKSNILLGTKCLADGSLPAVELYRDAVRYLKTKPDFPSEKWKDCAIAGRFFKYEKILIPACEIEKMLGGIVRQ